jgi:Holliday junction resolvase RusA-like endonuclease
MIHKITSPLYIDLPRKTMKDKRINLNMNTYRNLHHISNSKAKKLYFSLMRSQLKGLKITTPVEITYKVYKPTKRIMDKMNVISVVSKYLLDSITEYNCWEDDNDNFVKTETILPTEYDKDNPRVEIIITELK